MIIKGSGVILLSKEGITQGIPSAMKMYAIGILPLTMKLKDSSDFVDESHNQLPRDFIEHSPTWTQIWYADDSQCITNLIFVLFWMKLLIREGPKFGYYPAPEKNYLVVHATYFNEANALFSPFGVSIVEGSRVLGGFVGSKLEGDIWVSSKVDTWVQSLNILSEVAKKQPQAAYVAVSKSLQNEWSYLQRIHPDCDELFNPLRTALINNFIPFLIGNPITEIEFQIFENQQEWQDWASKTLLTTLFRHLILLLKAPKFYLHLYSQVMPLILTLMKLH